MEQKNDENYSINENPESKEQADVNASKSKKTNKLLKTIGFICRSIVVVLIILIFIVLIRAIAFKKYDVLGYKFYVIMSGSMIPTIDIGDVAVVKQNVEVKKNDIVAYSEGRATVVHRVIEVNNEEGEISYQTKGDNNNTQDIHKVKQEEIKGVYVGRIRKVGKAIQFINTHLIIFMSVIAIVILFIVIRRLI